MCLIVNFLFPSKESAIKASETPLIAKEDMKVYKILYFKKGVNQHKPRVYQSPYQEYIYKPGTHYFQIGKKFDFNIDITCDRFYELKINDGFHSFIYLYKAIKLSHRIILSKWHPMDVGIFEFIIPKGSEYFLGDDNDIVSDNLIFPYKVKKYKK